MADKPMITGPVKNAVKNAAIKIASKKSGKAGVQNWTDEEVEEGARRTGNRRGDAHWELARAREEVARLEKKYAAYADSFQTVFDESRRRRFPRGAN